MAGSNGYTLKQAQQDFATPAMFDNSQKAMSPEVLWQRFRDYVHKVKGDPILVHDFVGKDGDSVHREKEKPITMEGFENYLEDLYGIGAIQQYLENRAKAYNDYVPIVARIKREIRDDHITGGFVGIYKENITARVQGLNDNLNTKEDRNVNLMNFDSI